MLQRNTNAGENAAFLPCAAIGAVRTPHCAKNPAGSVDSTPRTNPYSTVCYAFDASV